MISRKLQTRIMILAIVCQVFISLGLGIEKKVEASGSNTSPNLIYNGDFELGNVGFISSLTMQDVEKTGIGYSIQNKVTFCGPNNQLSDHTSGNGNLFNVFPSTHLNPLNYIWEQRINSPLKRAGRYKFFAYIASSCDKNRPIIDVEISVNGNDWTSILEPIRLENDMIWNRIEGNYFSSLDYDSFRIRISDLETNGMGNDFALDDLYFGLSDDIFVTNITLDQSNLSLNKGQTSQLIATIEPTDATTQTVYWDSSNSAIASVDSTGKVTAVGIGTAIITASTKDGGYFASAIVTVKTPVTAVQLNRTQVSLTINASSQLSATVFPLTSSNKSVTWTSSNSAVAAVDSSGKVTAKGNGTATISVTTVDGGYKATATVTVTTPVTGITIQSPVSEILQVEDNLSLKATVSPMMASNKNVYWYSSDESIATVSSTGVVTGISDGQVTITVETVDGGYTSIIDLIVESPNEYVFADSVKMNVSQVTIEKDKTAVLKATVLPSNTTDKSIVWTSSNPSVAIVNSKGVVKALRKGTAIITATNESSFQSAMVTITVFNKVYTDATDVFEITSPAVAFLEAYDANNKLVSTASGFLISPDGRLVTNLHAILNGTTPISYVKAIFPDKAYNRITTVLGYDTTNDIAILQINGVSNLPYIDLADPAELKTGQKVLAIGSPAKLENSLTGGMISSKMRKIADTVYIQTDVGIANGSSGGVLLNMKGEAVGITTAGFGVPSANLNLAIPIESLKVVATNNPKLLSEITDVKIVTIDGIKKYSLKTISVTSIKLDKTTLSLAAKQTAKLKVTFTPTNPTNKKVTWTSSNTKVATVDANGKVTAVAKGTATITVKTTDGNKTAKCTVTVK